MSSATPDAAQRYKMTLSEMVALLQDLVRVRPGQNYIKVEYLAAVHIYMGTANPYTLISTFIHNTFPYWNQVLDKDESFFVDNLLKLIPNEHQQIVQGIPALIVSLQPDEKVRVWMFVTALVKISLSYVHEQRVPTWSNGSKRYATPAYTGRSFDVPQADGSVDQVMERKIPLAQLAHSFEVALVWPAPN